MMVEPYDVVLEDRVMHRAKVTLDDGGIVDLESEHARSQLEWEEFAARNVMPIDPSPAIPQDSPIEAEFKAERDALKISAITYMHQNPGCTFDELLASIEANGVVSPAGLLSLYVSNAAASGVIPEATFEAFRDWANTLTLEQLMAI